MDTQIDGRVRRLGMGLPDSVGEGGARWGWIGRDEMK